MKFEQEERDKLQTKKKIEKQTAIREVFSNVNEKTGKIEAKTSEVKRLELERTQNKWNEKEVILEIHYIKRKCSTNRSSHAGVVGWTLHMQHFNC